MAVLRQIEPDVTLVVPGCDGFEAACRFAEAQYQERLSCSLTDYYPAYLVFSQTGDIGAVVGVRPAGAAPLFLEHYLEEDIEVHLDEAVSGAAPGRARIVELGCFAAVDREAALRLMIASAEFLNAEGFQYVVCVANRAIRCCLAKLGIPIVELGKVDPARVPGGAAAWGDYYAGEPLVLAGSIEAGRGAMRLLRGLAA